MQQVQDLIEQVGKQFKELDTDLQHMTPEVRNLNNRMSVFDNELRHLRDELVGLRGEARALHHRLDDAEKARQQREEKRAEQQKQERLERAREGRNRRIVAIGLWIAAAGTLFSAILGVISILSNSP